MGAYRNPLLPGCHPDPSICRVGSTYYLATSTFEYAPGLPIHRSKNLVDWELIGHAIHRPGQLDFTGISASKGLYAPTLRYHEGTFFLVCTVVPGDEAPPARAGHFLVTASDPAGPWSDPIWFEGVGGIDPSLTFDNGRVWLCGTEWQNPGKWDGQCDVWLVELDPRTYQPLTAPSVIWQGGLFRAGWAEGPHLYPSKEGGWMLLAAEGGTDRDHSVCVAYADDITGPYVGDPGNPRLTNRHLGDSVPIVNVGHADLVEDEDGRTWALALGTVQSDGVNGLCGRQTHMIPVAWEGRKPVFAPGVGMVSERIVADGVPDQSRWAVEDGVDLLDQASDLQWNAVRWFPEEFVERDAGAMVIRATPTEATEVGTTSFLGTRVPAPRAELSATIALEPGAGELRAGLMIRTTETALLEVAFDRKGAIQLKTVDDSIEKVRAQGRVDAAASHELRIVLDGRQATVFVGGVEFGSVATDFLATGRPLWFLGSWFGPFAVGAGSVRVEKARVTA